MVLLSESPEVRTYLGRLAEQTPPCAQVQVAAGECHTVLLRSDGRVVVCGAYPDGECTLPEAKDGIVYWPALSLKDFVVQLLIDGARTVSCRSLTGQDLATLRVHEDDLGRSMMLKLSQELSRPGMRLRVLLPDGSLLTCSRTWAQLFVG